MPVLPTSAFADAATTLVVSTSVSNPHVGVAFDFSVTAVDATDTVDTAFANTVHFSSSDPLAVLPDDYTFLPGDMGTRVFSVAFGTAGTESLTATDTTKSLVSGVLPPVTVVIPISQTVSFTSTAPTGAMVGGPTYTPTASATSVLPVTITIDSTSSSVCSISTGVVSFTAIGNCVIDANQAGDSTYAAAPQVQQSFTVSQGSQTVNIASSAPAATVGTTYTPTATATSGLPVTVTIDSTSSANCTIIAGVVTFTAVGSCVIDANQDGNVNYSPALQVQQSVTVGKGSQTITFGSSAPVGPTVGGPTYGASATSDSGLTVALTIDPTAASVCSNSGATVSFTGVGTCIVDANQAGNTNYSAATQAEQSFAVGKGSQAIAFSQVPTGMNVGATGKVMHAAATSTLAVTYGSQTTGICAVNSTSGALTLLAVGACTITADQAGNANWGAAPEVTVGFAVSPPFTLPILTVTPDPQTLPFGTANPAFTYAISGFINNQTLATALVTGAPACTTTATIFSPAGTYPITCSIGTLTSPFYSFTFVPGTLTIVHGASSVTLSTTTTVFEASTPVTWTAAVEPGVTGATPAGSLVFTIDGVARPPVPLDSNGRGSLTVTWATPGLKSVQVSYAGDASFAPSGTASAAPQVVANTARATGLGVAETTFYPLVDGWRDTVTVRGTRREPLSVSISVKNASGTVVRTFTARTASGPYAWAWNGRTSSGTALPAGVYTITQTLTDPYGTHPRAVKTAKVTLSLRRISWSTVTVTARPGPRCFQFTSGDGVGAYSCGSAGALALTGSDGHWPGVGYQFTLPTGIGYRSIRVEVLGAFSGGRPTVGLHVWSLGTTWGQLYRPGWRRTAISPTAKTWSGVTFTSPDAYISGRSVRVYMDGGGRLGGPFRFSTTGIRLIVSVGTLQ
jgi:hypothetical protein